MLNERQIRQQKLTQCKKEGINPYPAQAKSTAAINNIVADFEKFTGQEIYLSGRLLSFREHGGITFTHLADASGRIQLVFQENILGKEKYHSLKLLDIGDFIQVKGETYLTKKREKSLNIKDFKILAKALRPLPEKWHGLKDEEERFRRRYLDLLCNPSIKELFLKKQKFISEFRNFLTSQDFFEVETPVLENIPGGADANPFVTHHETLDIDLYLRISLELHLKRLLIGGYEKVFEIGKVFRNEGISTEHLQEFTLLEFYWAYHNYEDLMAFVEKLYTHVVVKVFPEKRGGFKTPWLRLNFCDLIKKETGVDVLKLKKPEELKNKIELEKGMSLARAIDRLYKKYVRPKIKGPAFLKDLPVIISPLAKKKENNPDLTERILVLLDGVEVGNGFSELNDPQEQRQRFEEQMQMRAKGDREAQMMDKDFVEALEYGMPPTAGFGVGLDRLFMLLTASKSIREVVLFPILRPK